MEIDYSPKTDIVLLGTTFKFHFM